MSTRTDLAHRSRRRPPCPLGRLAAAVALAGLLAADPPVATADTVTLTTGDDHQGQMVIEGEVVDWNGREIVIRSPGGAQRTYPAARVKQVQTNWPEGYLAGRAALADGDYRQAARQLTAAAQQAARPWVRRLAIAQLIDCYAATGDWTTAGRLLVELARSDPQTPAIDRPPLAWFPVEGVAPSTVNTWLNDQQSEVAQLLGASHAMPTSQRAQAVERLRRLQRSEDPRIAFLARAQRWRAEVATVSAEELDRWQRRTLAAPEAVQPGGWLVVGDGYRQLRRYDPAALAYLRAEMLAAGQVQLAAHALWQAAQTVQAAGHADEARRLAEQLIAEYPQTPPAREARRMLQSAE